MTDAKRELVRDWLTRASHDLIAARKLSAEPDSHLDTAIYHCQQAGEKAVKGFLAWHDEAPVRTHNIVALAEQAANYETGFSAQRNAATRLTRYVTEFRYPGGPIEPPRPEFDQALADATGIYNFVLSLLPGEVHPTP